VTVTSDGGTTGDLFSEAFTFSGTTYTDYHKEFTATNAGATLRFEENSTNSKGRDPFLDAVSVTAVPEPSSVALLGLGGLTLILRRRK
jgi:hypothetical protein